MALITIGTNLIDVADVALVAPSSSTTSTVYLADGQQLESALTAADQATAVNGTAAGTLLTTVVASTNYGACYISGVNVQRVLEAGAGTLWFLRGGPGPVVCPSTDPATAQTLINSASGVSPSTPTYAAAAEFVPTWVAEAGTAVVRGAQSWTRIGPAGASAPAVGDIVTVTTRWTCTVLDGDVLSGSVEGLPANIASMTGGGWLSVQLWASRLSGGLVNVEGLEVTRGGATALAVDSPNWSATGNTTFILNIWVSYPAAA